MCAGCEPGEQRAERKSGAAGRPVLVGDMLQLLEAQAQVDADGAPVLSDLQGDGQQVGLRQVPALGVPQVQRGVLTLLWAAGLLLPVQSLRRGIQHQ